MHFLYVGLLTDRSQEFVAVGWFTNTVGYNGLADFSQFREDVCEKWVSALYA